jgi:hypothetical protein
VKNMNNLMGNFVNFFQESPTFFKQKKSQYIFWGMDKYRCRPQKLTGQLDARNITDNIHARYLTSVEAQPFFSCIQHVGSCISYSVSCGYDKTTGSNSKGY